MNDIITTEEATRKLCDAIREMSRADKNALFRQTGSIGGRLDLDFDSPIRVVFWQLGTLVRAIYHEQPQEKPTEEG